ncbi:MAG: helix-turn-helix domain-containing protein [Clostridia bacterium]|nr:helix-turn-helix domain-containing protein [Clostridia bacterium]
MAVIREHERSVEKGCAVVHLASNFSIRKVAPNLDMTPCSIGAVYAWLLERGCDVETLDVFFRDFVTSTDAYNPAVVLRGRIERKEISSGDMTAEFARASGVRMTESVEAVRRDLLTAREAAEYTGYAESTIQSAAHCGDLAVADTGVRGARLFERSVLDAWKRKLNGTPQRCPRKRGKKGVAREVLS